MKEPVWVRADMVAAVHERLLTDHGGPSGLRDGGLLDSALARPRQILAYGSVDPDLAALAAAYAVGIVRNHPFVDGNKRVAFMTAYVFLACNDVELTAAEADATAAILQLAARELSEAQFAQWLRDSTEPVGGQGRCSSKP
jgi:death-on-curing protein